MILRTIRIALVVALGTIATTGTVLGADRNGERQDSVMTREQLAAVLASLELRLPHFQTTYEINYKSVQPDDLTTPWSDVQTWKTQTVDLLVSDGLMRAEVTEDGKGLGQAGVYVWDGQTTTHRSRRDDRTRFSIWPTFELPPGRMGCNETELFNGTEDLFPVRGRLRETIRSADILSQVLRGGMLTHRCLSHLSERGCQVETIVLRLEPRLELLSYTLLISSATNPEEAEEHVRMKTTLEIAEWQTIGDQRIPSLMYRDSISRRDNQVRRGRTIYRRLGFTDRTGAPPGEERFRLPLEYGAEVFDRGSAPGGRLWFAVGGRSLQYGRLLFEFDDPILEHPGEALAQLIKRAHVQLGPDRDPFGVNPALELIESGGPGDAVRDRLRGLEQERPVLEADRPCAEVLAEIARKLEDWHAERADMLGRLFELEPSAPDLPALMPYRWKYWDLLSRVELEPELHAFTEAHPGAVEAIDAGAYWLAAHRATAPGLAPMDRERAVDPFIRDHAEDLRSARLLILAWIACDDPITADRLRRRVATEYPDSSEGRTLFGEIRREEAVGERVAFTFTDRLSGREMSMESLRGKVIALNFWATWCGPCVGSMPLYKEHYAKLKEQYGKRFEMIGISLDADPQVAVAFCRENDVPWPQLCEEGKTWDTSVARTFGVSGVPRTIIVGSDGRIRVMEARARSFLASEVSNVFRLEEAERQRQEDRGKGPDRDGAP